MSNLFENQMKGGKRKKEKACLTIGNEVLACEQYSAEKNDISLGLHV